MKRLLFSNIFDYYLNEFVVFILLENIFIIIWKLCNRLILKRRHILRAIMNSARISLILKHSIDVIFFFYVMLYLLPKIVSSIFFFNIIDLKYILK